MMKIKSTPFLLLANIYILLSIAYYWFETSIFLNPVAIALLVVFGLHLFIAKGGAKLIFPSVFIAINLYMFLALFSEFSEFSTLRKEALILLIVGIFYLGLNVLCAIIMLINYTSPTQFEMEM